MSTWFVDSELSRFCIIRILSCISVVGIRFHQASTSVIEGDVVTILITADHIAEENITIMVQVTSLTASGNQRVLRMYM